MWILGHIVLAIIGGTIAARIVETLGSGLNHTVLSWLRTIFFAGTVTTVTTTSGMSRFTSWAEKGHRISGAVRDRVNSITNTKREP